MYRCEHCGALNRVPNERPEGAATCGRCRQTLELSGAPQSVGSADLQRVLDSSDVPVVLDFWAPWCGPCKASAPTYEAIAKNLTGRALFLKINTDEHPDLGNQYAVRGIPTFVILQHGQEVARRSGAPPRAQFEEWVTAHVQHAAASHP